jgi:hypothetical protein
MEKVGADRDSSGTLRETKRIRTDFGSGKHRSQICTRFLMFSTFKGVKPFSEWGYGNAYVFSAGDMGGFVPSVILDFGK